MLIICCSINFSIFFIVIYKCSRFSTYATFQFADDFRIFCGDLGNDVTDEVLIRAFSKYASFVKAKVIRDKRTNKTKGYGFVSFKDPQDFIKAMREMNGKCIISFNKINFVLN